MAFTLNIQTSLTGQWELVNVGYAQDSGGSGTGDDGGGTACGPYDYDDMLLKAVTCVLVWQKSFQCKEPAQNKCCKAESQRSCSGSGWPDIP